jgi:hypothetical protein
VAATRWNPCRDIIKGFGKKAFVVTGKVVTKTGL